MTKVSETTYERIPGIYEPIEHTVTYTVCDECGSSDIGQVGIHLGCINVVFLLVVIASFSAAITVAFVTFDLKLLSSIGLLLLIACVTYLALEGYVTRNNHLKCNKCGNEHIT